MIRAKCLDCHQVQDFEPAYPTAAPEIVKVECGTCRGKRYATRVPTSPSGKPVDLVAEAERIFADVLVDPIIPPVSDARKAARAAAAATAPDQADPILEDDDRVEAAYRAWLGTDNGRTVSVAIRDRALGERSLGKAHASIQRLAELVRDEAVAAGRDEAGYRVNNSHLSRLARDLMRKYPELVGFFEIRELRSVGSCRSCGAPVRWGETKAGKRNPFNPDGTSHFGTCPDAKRWSRNPAPKEA